MLKSSRFAACLLSTAASMFVAESAAHAGDKIVYTYDARGRLVAVSVTEGPHAGTNVTTAYDAADNRTGHVVTGADAPPPAEDPTVGPTAPPPTNPPPCDQAECGGSLPPPTP